MAADISWARTPNRTERTEAARRAGPTRIEHWIAKIRAEGKVREQDIVKNAESMLRAHMTKVSLAAAEARRVKAAGQESDAGSTAA
jgi:hypothetical protein